MLTLDFINVGYGDALLVRQGGFNMLVDCGDVSVGRAAPQSPRVTAADYLREQGVTRLDLLVLTHLHLDHAGGLTRLLDSGIKVAEMWTNYLPKREYWGGRVSVPAGLSQGAKCLMASLNVYLDALKKLDGQGTRVRLADVSGETAALTPSLTAGVYLEERALLDRQAEILAQTLRGNISGAELDELDGFINNTSIRLRLNYAGRGVELPGDVYAWCWEKHELLPCALVKLPHHGHADAVTERLISMLRPAHAVISVSDDRTDDCPSPEVIRELRRAGVDTRCTDTVALPDLEKTRVSALRYELTPEGDIRRV